MFKDVPVRAGYLQLGGGYQGDVGWFARGELGYRPYDSLAAFAFGQIDKTAGPSLGVGARWKF